MFVDVGLYVYAFVCVQGYVWCVCVCVCVEARDLTSQEPFAKSSETGSLIGLGLLIRSILLVSEPQGSSRLCLSRSGIAPYLACFLLVLEIKLRPST